MQAHLINVLDNFRSGRETLLRLLTDVRVARGLPQPDGERIEDSSVRLRWTLADGSALYLAWERGIGFRTMTISRSRRQNYRSFLTYGEALDALSAELG